MAKGADSMRQPHQAIWRVIVSGQRTAPPVTPAEARQSATCEQHRRSGRLTGPLNRTWVLRTTGVNVNGGWMTSPFGS